MEKVDKHNIISAKCACDVGVRKPINRHREVVHAIFLGVFIVVIVDEHLVDDQLRVIDLLFCPWGFGMLGITQHSEFENTIIEISNDEVCSGRILLDFFDLDVGVLKASHHFMESDLVSLKGVRVDMRFSLVLLTDSNG